MVDVVEASVKELLEELSKRNGGRLRFVESTNSACCNVYHKERGSYVGMIDVPTGPAYILVATTVIE